MPALSPLLWKVVGGLIALLLVASGSYYEGHHHEALAFQDYKNQQAAVAAKQVASNQTAVAAITASEAEGLRKIAATRQEQVDAIKKTNDALVAANSDLADKLQRYLTRTGGRRPIVHQAAAGPGGSDAASDAALPVGLQQFTGWLTGQFYEADRLAVNLTAAQQVIEQDRLICNGQLPGISP